MDSDSPSASESAAPPAPKPTLFIVDDSATVRAHVAMILAKEGKCVCFPNVEDAIKAANLAPQPPALFISDVLMEPTDGYEFCRQVRASPTLRISSFLLLTAAEHTDWWTIGLKVGADDFMVKPFRPPELLARVHSLVALFTARVKLKEEKEAREKIEAELAGAKGQLEQLQKELAAVKQASIPPVPSLDSEIRIGAQLAQAFTPPLNNITQSIQQLMDAVKELEKPESDERVRRLAIRSARTGYAQGLNELDRIQILLQDDPKKNPATGT